MGLSKQAQANRPKRPNNAYFKFRNQKMRQLGDAQGKIDQIKKLWEQIDPKLKNQLEAEYKKGLSDYPAAFEAWKKKYNVTDAELKKEKESKKKTKEPQEEQKNIKTKGVKEKQVSEDKKGKKNKTPEKERGKSKKDEKKDDKKDKKSAQKKKK